MEIYPSITVITCLYNPDQKIWEESLNALSSQNYPKNKIEHIILDGGSTNTCIDLVKKYKNTLLIRKDLKDKPLQRMKLGIEKARGEILLFLEPDNIIIGKKWLKQMVAPFVYSKEVIGTFSIHNTYRKNMPLLTKYSALIGVNDPVVFYLDKSEKMPLSQNNYTKGKILERTKDFAIVEFNEEDFPTLGDNGHMVRSQPLKKIIEKQEEYYHTDAFFALLKEGANKYGVVRNKIIHYTGGDFNHFFSKRVLYKRKYYDNNKKRLYFVFNSHSRRDIFKLILFIIFSITFVQPLMFSINSYIHYRERAWFIHPIACFLATAYYAKSQVAYILRHRQVL